MSFWINIAIKYKINFNLQHKSFYFIKILEVFVRLKLIISTYFFVSFSFKINLIILLYLEWFSILPFLAQIYFFMDYLYLRSQQSCVICVKFLSAIFIMLSFYIFKGYEEMLLQNSAKLFKIQLNRVFQPFMQL